MIRGIVTIAVHEFTMMFRSAYGWVALALVTFIAAYFFYANGQQYLLAAQYNPNHDLGVVRSLGVTVIGVFNQSLLFLTPLITAGSISAEHRNHTIVLMQSSPIGSWEIVIGKFRGIQWYYFTLLTVAALMVGLLHLFNPLDFLHLASIFIGSMLLLSMYVAIGIYCSTLSKNFFVSAVVCLMLLLILFFVTGALAREYPAFDWLVINKHIQPFYQGEVDTRHIAFFLLMIALFLFLARQRLESARRA